MSLGKMFHSDITRKIDKYLPVVYLAVAVYYAYERDFWAASFWVMMAGLAIFLYKVNLPDLIRRKMIKKMDAKDASK
jgi:hypothetical protein